MKSYRIFVEKYPEFRVEAESLLRDLNANLNLSLDGLRLLNVYDLFGFSDELLEKSRYRVFGEVVTDAVTDSCDLGGNSFLAVECLPGQFDQRAASAVDCVRLIDPSAEVKIKSSKLLIFPSKLPKETMERIRRYYINAVESREKDLRVLDDLESAPRETGAGIGRVPGDGRCGTRCLLQEERSGDECRRPARSGRIFPERGSRSVRNRAADSRYVLERPLPSYDLHDRAGEHYGRGVVRERRDRRHAGALPENPPRTGARGQEHLPDGPGDDRCPLPAQQGTARRPGGERGEQRMQRFRRCGRR